MQIATRSGVPPSQIALAWSVEELLQAEALARLEGWGQEKRRTAAILAEVHNAARVESYQRGDRRKKPKLLSEDDFLPRRVRRKEVQLQRAQAVKSLTSLLDRLCGFG